MAASPPSAVLTRAITDRPADAPLPPPSAGSGLYLLLALALGGMVVLSLMVNGQIERSVFRSVSTSEEWARKFSEVSTLGNLAMALDAPGNDVFLDRQVALQRGKMVEAADSLTVRIERLTSLLPESLSVREADLVRTDLDRVAINAVGLRGEADLVFRALERHAQGEATIHMARMDQWFAATLRGIRTLRADLGAAQDALIETQRRSAESSSRLLRLAGLLMFILAVGGGWLGFRLAREAERQGVERDRTMQLVAVAQAELEVAHSRLTAAHKELESFSYSVAHDLRAPLRSIHGFSEALEQDNRAQLDAQGLGHLAKIRAASLRMGHLIDDLLRLSKVTRHSLAPAEVDLSALAAEVMAELRAQDPDRQAAVTVASELRASADPALARVLLQNLLGNAWKFTRRTREARIEFSVERSGNGGPDVYAVRDNGAGFDMTYAGKLFGAFQRMHTVSEFEGTGVGLATVARIVERHGGRVWAEAEVGRGATFRFTLRR
jgi:signal transduction histidine kinase